MPPCIFLDIGFTILEENAWQSLGVFLNIGFAILEENA